jgi:hypothetical protein
MSKSRKRRPGSRERWLRANVDRVRGYQRKYYRKNRRKKRAKTAQWRANNPDRVAAYTVREDRKTRRREATRRWHAKKFGYTECTVFPPPPADNKCSICHREAPVALDHDHETGRFRGYLCRECNMGLGKLGDTVEAIRRVLQYLEQANV